MIGGGSLLKAYKIVNDNDKKPCGTLCYDTDTNYFYLDIEPTYPIEKSPAILAAYKSMGKESLNHNETLRFIRDRIIPAERQNIEQVLHRVGVDEYSELSMLEYTMGRCCMDDFYIEDKYY